MFIGNKLQQVEVSAAAADFSMSAIPPSSSSSYCINPFCSTNNAPPTSSSQQQRGHQNILNVAVVAPSKKKRRKTNTDSTDIIAKEINELSVEDREKIYEDIHGVSDLKDETPEFVKEKLMEMNEALDNNTNKISSKQLRD